MALKSLDPRITRLQIAEGQEPPVDKEALDQFVTFQAFIQPKEGKPYEHAGIVHAPNIEMAFLFSKEQYSRRNPCIAMFIIRTTDIMVTPFTEGDVNIYDLVDSDAAENTAGVGEKFQIFHLRKRGKQHVHVGAVEAGSFEEAMVRAKKEYNEGKVLNVWLAKDSDILFIDEGYRDIWDTLPQKEYRNAIAYRSTDKIKKYKEQHNPTRA